MSKLNQIQTRLQEIEGGLFQKLADAYLHRKGYELINPLGSLIGVDKVKRGTPDTFIPLPNGKYVFAEYTTQQDRLLEKLKTDLENCFDETKTGIPVGKIQEIVFCFNSKLEPPEQDILREICQSRGVVLNLFGIGPISFDLYQKYRGIAKDLLGIEVDTGQILSPDEFVTNYGRHALATPLDTEFHFRETEIANALRCLESSDIIIISGRPGVGKSRFALECCKRFLSVRQDFKGYCILNRGPDIYQDLRTYFAEPGNYFILVDDANRINRFEYVLQLLDEQNPGKRIKIIATVRDYALQKISDSIRDFGVATEVVLQPFKDEEIRKLVEDLYGIKNHLYLERIAEIAKGNPRLAVMAAALAKRTNSFESIANVSTLYDEYYSSVRSELSELDNPNLLKSAGIVAFFRVVDFTDKKLLKEIQLAFEVQEDEFWKAVRRLHELEIFDLYEKEVVRVSDQIMATYLFYLAFFKERVLDFSVLLNFFFPQLRQRFLDALNPVLDAFYGEPLLRVMRPTIDRAWEEATRVADDERLLHLMDMFFYLKETDVLLYCKRKIQGMETESLTETLDVSEVKQEEIKTPSILSILSSFKYMEATSFKIALDLLLDYLEKRPNEFTRISFILADRFGFNHRSYMNNFIIQRIVVETVLERAKKGNNLLITKLFLLIARRYLHTDFDTTEYKGGREFTMIRFQLPAVPSLFELRATILRGVIEHFSVEGMKDAVLEVIHRYSTSGYHVSSEEIIKQDSELLLPFIRERFDRNDTRQCFVACEYFEMLQESGAHVDDALRKEFKTDIIEISELLQESYFNANYRDLSPDQYLEKRKSQLRDYLKHHGTDELQQFVDKCVAAFSTVRDGHKQRQFREGFGLSMVAIAEHGTETFLDVLEYYLSLGDPLKVEPYFIISKLIERTDPRVTLTFLSKQTFSSKRRWLFTYYTLLKPDQVNDSSVSGLIDLYTVSYYEEMPHHLDFLLNYESVKAGTIGQIIKIVLGKTEENPDSARALTMLFNPYTELSKKLTTLFEHEKDLLKRLYLAVMKVDPHIDHNRQIMASIMNLDKSFIIEYIDWIYGHKKWVSGHDDMHDYSFLWMRPDHNELMTAIVDHVYKKEQEGEYPRAGYLETFFIPHGEKKDDGTQEVEKRQDEFIRRLIESRHKDLKFMRYLFWMIAEFGPDRRREFLKEFLKHNKEFDHFEQIPIEPTHWSAHGSWVPVIQGRIDYMESLLPMLNTADLLQHKQLVEQHIEHLRKYMESEKKRDFMED